MLIRKNWESFRRPYKVPVEFLGNAKPWFTQHQPHDRNLSRLGGCCKGGGFQNNRRGSSFGLQQQVETKAPLKSGLCLYQQVETKTGAPFVVLTAPPLQQPPTLNHVSTPGMGIREIQKSLHGL